MSSPTKSTHSVQGASRATSFFAWQGWRLELPRSWNPVKLEGDYKEGHALFADMDRPRLGLRWQMLPAKRFDARDWAVRAMRDEVGRLAAEEAKPMPLGMGFDASLLYLDPEPPGRDVWVARSNVSGRAIEIIYHAHRRDRTLAEAIVPSIADADPAKPMDWAVFDLACQSPAGFRLSSQRLNAGDLSLTFRQKRQWATVRQVALAELALARRSLDKWLGEQLGAVAKYYAPAGSLRDVSETVGGRAIDGFSRDAARRRRFAWMRWLPPRITTQAFHDAQRDRLVIVQGTCADRVRELAATVGRPPDKL